MRKFYIRWWYTSDWEREQYERMIRDWNGDWTPIKRAMIASIPPCPYFTPEGVA